VSSSKNYKNSFFSNAMVVVDGTLPMKDLLRIGFRELFKFIEPFTVL